MDVIQTVVCVSCGETLSIRFTYDEQSNQRTGYVRCPVCEHVNPQAIRGDGLVVRCRTEPVRRQSA